MTESAKEVAVFLREEYSKTKITRAELEQTMDSSKIIEGPSPDSSVTSKKVALLNEEPQYSQELVTLPVLSLSEVLLSEFSNAEYRNVLTFKASSFISDQTRSSANFEVKAVRAIWDPSLAIPGTNRRGGFRCPVGTRYGGQITDRFGRSCGWGVARRIANQIADIGERLEQRDDGKRKRRLDRRNARMIARLQGGERAGRLEGGLRDIAQRLDGDGSAPRAPRPPRAIDPVREANRQEALAELRRIRDDVVMPRVPIRRARQAPRDEEVETPSARSPRNRRRDVIPATAPTPKPKPKPAPQERRRPQPRPQVAPQPENVDVLTAREASDAGESEAFKPYVLRKYNEYAQRVREIREGGGNAGMLTRREWYAINKDNLRDAWKDVHGRSAPQDFEPPAPRRPQNNRRRRRAATAVPAGRSASRKPTANDVPEPAPAKPVRPSPRKTPRPPAKASTVDKNAPTANFDHSGVAYRDFRSAQNKARQLAARENQDFHVVNYAGNGFGDGADKYYVLDNDQYEALRANEALNAPNADGIIGWREEGLVPAPNRLQPPAPITPPIAVGPTNLPPVTPPTPPRAPRPQIAVGRNAQELKMNNLVDNHDASMPKLQPDDGKFVAVPIGNKGINTLLDARRYTGSLADIPDEFLLEVIQKRTHKSGGGASPNVVEAVQSVFPSAQGQEVLNIVARLSANLRKSLNEVPPTIDQETKNLIKALKDKNIEFLQVSVGNGVTSPQYYFHLSEDSTKWGRGYFLKKPDNDFDALWGGGKNMSQHSELVGNVLARQLGFANGAPRIVKGTSDKPFLLMDIFVNNAEGKVRGRYNASEVTDAKSRFFNGALNAMMDVADRHPGNGDQIQGNGAIPLDFGRAKFTRKSARAQLTYLANFGMDSRPWRGYSARLVGKNQEAQEIENRAIRAELEADIALAVEKMREGLLRINEIDDAYDALDTVTKSARLANIQYNISQFASPQFLNGLMERINTL